jgi:hypothetical protein
MPNRDASDPLPSVADDAEAHNGGSLYYEAEEEDDRYEDE